MKLVQGDIKTYYEVFGFDDIEGLGTSLTQKDTFEAADNFANSLNYQTTGYFDEVTLNLKLHIIKVTSEVLN